MGALRLPALTSIFTSSSSPVRSPAAILPLKQRLRLPIRRPFSTAEKVVVQELGDGKGKVIDKEKDRVITPRSQDFNAWYLDVIANAELADYGPVRGTMVIRPYGYAIWEAIQEYMNVKFKETGHSNMYFPQFIPYSFIEKEASHVEGFSPELALVTVGGGKELEEKLVVRPTSETIVNHMFTQWIHSYRDLPLMINQWANVTRWEMRTKPFIRTLEFLWQEGHTAHATAEEAEKEAMQMIDIYTKFAYEQAAIPVIAGRKSRVETFAGASTTYTIEAMMGDGKALQAGTSHNLGQNFSRAFGTQSDFSFSIFLLTVVSTLTCAHLTGYMLPSTNTGTGVTLSTKARTYGKKSPCFCFCWDLGFACFASAGIWDLNLIPHGSQPTSLTHQATPLDENGQRKHVWQTSWAISTRFVGGIIMTHGDDAGLLLPPRLAPMQVVIVPIWKKDNEKTGVLTASSSVKETLQAAGIKVKIDDSDQRTPGWKFNYYEMKGVPLRIEIGPRDVSSGTVVISRRDVPGKQGKVFGISMEPSALGAYVKDKLNEVPHYDDWRSNIVDVYSYDELKEAIAQGKWARGPWSAGDEEELKVKEETGATLRCFPFEQPEGPKKCLMTGNSADEVAIFAKSY
ncbi:hypothetical protein RND71_000978 [Anisodus tanguticus]|uniref:proline--tRNA ligase n=1 Tax=Anisodus tanguticus TaxID=243964 RepID=A0AAE1T240_9SOLA|nr:hypothetical protein RND71_000978 [Anisodus tanguticus]